MTYIVAMICVFGIAAGQILFKMSASSLHKTGSFFDITTATIICSAFALYGITTIGWIWVLQKSDLGRIYPLMALAFVLVPIGSYLFFQERFNPQYFVGVTLIIGGIIVAVKS
ncbi:4-amino-4-deoxy-L-arabinose-phospho-UDP flippase [Pseudomonas sp. PGPR40]|uniref:4-amino-4-deoxy-L-arabinose-phospho-UDP flippase n=1 Tax=Pseudomonas sp. PGPR40 TaxID=2913476 RepID=UPI001EDB453B|nr:4-amino-4-deoxy-L-arabinose-phospho-UDP flippase [Pseudomonas sp. PGPR40]